MTLSTESQVILVQIVQEIAAWRQIAKAGTDERQTD